MTKLLRRFGGLGCSHELTSFRCRGSPFLRNRRSIDLIPNRRLMETAAGAGEPSPAPAADPRWLLLNRYGSSMDDDDASTAIADKTTVCSRTSTGRPFRVSVNLAAPPATSFIHCDWPDRSEDEQLVGPEVVAADGDSILLKLMEPLNIVFGSGRHRPVVDHFVYTAGAGRPPSLSLLPACYIPTLCQRNHLPEAYRHKKELPWTSRKRVWRTEDTGLLRCGGDDGGLLVAQLEVTHDAPYDTAELCVLRHGREWELKREVPIVPVANKLQWCRETRKYIATKSEPPLRWPETSEAIAVGDRFLCWANCYEGTFLVCDMTEEGSPKLHYVPLPVDPVVCKDMDYSDEEDYRAPICNCRAIAAAGADAVRLISVDHRCCCGGRGRSTCVRSRFASRVSSWILQLSSMDRAVTWDNDGLHDSDELWAMPGYEGLPRVYPECPVMSSDNPDVVCFIVCEEHFDSNGERKVWMIEVDTKRKALLSACRSTSYPCPGEKQHLAVNLHC